MIRKGNNKFKTLHKGSELITRVFKGDELIYQDIDALYSWKFTINTKKNTNGAETNTYKTLQIGFNQPQENPNVPFTPVDVDWGDGSTDTITYSGSAATASHTYSVAGTYQVKLLPTVFDGGTPRTGWLSGLYIGDNNRIQIVSIDKAFPEGSYNFSLQSSNRNTIPVRNTSNPFSFQSMRNLVSVPANLFSNVTFVETLFGKPYVGGKFNYLCHYCGFNILPENKDYNIMSVVKVLFDKLDATGSTGYSFMQTFAEINADTIPAGLFDFMETSSATDLLRVFYQTFYRVAQKSATATIPAGLFDSVDTSNATSVYEMFYGTFMSAFSEENNNNYGSTVAEIPDRLLPLDYPKATNVEGLFDSTFYVGLGMSSEAEIPEHIFDGLNLPKAASVARLFRRTFYWLNKSTAGIPEHLFDNMTLNDAVTNTSQMFEGTFSAFGYFYNVNNPPTTTNTIPAGLFDSVDMSHVTNCYNMFKDTFDRTFKTSTTATIPAGLFDFIDMTNVTVAEGMFSGTFSNYAYSSTVATIPAGLFDHIDTSSCTSLRFFFSSTFSNYGTLSPAITIPQGIFDHLDTSSATNVVQLFSSTFSNFGSRNTSITIPADLFDMLDLSVATSEANMFTSTFYNFGTSSTVGTIPAGLFSAVGAPNTTNCQYMFQSTFSGAFKASTVADIPGDIFAYVNTSNVPSIAGMFYGTFNGYGQASLVNIIPSNLFPSNLDFSGNTNFSDVFRETFQNAFNISNRQAVPSTLFQNIDMSSATNTSSTFYGTFQAAAIAEVPQGIFGNVKVGAANHNYTFAYAFAAAYRTPASTRIQLNDPFDGMTDFTWASASDITALKYMFGSNEYSPGSVTNVYQPILDGSASTVLQHFNFTPASDTDMFLNQKFLTDYSTIANNWK